MTLTLKQLEDMRSWYLANDRTICRQDGEQPSDFNTVAEFWNSGEAAMVIGAIDALLNQRVYNVRKQEDRP